MVYCWKDRFDRDGRGKGRVEDAYNIKQTDRVVLKGREQACVTRRVIVQRIELHLGLTGTKEGFIVGNP